MNCGAKQIKIFSTGPGRELSCLFIPGSPLQSGPEGNRLLKNNLWRFSVFLRGIPRSNHFQMFRVVHRTAGTGIPAKEEFLSK
ncbi:MAG: hypothetical protein A2066_12525 [Bacteroidetes bacterium GWB2_41_8]|nr:MAG: hypothetical protein A2066_12525 [Bacteroidetes bacterium GWB2_41_8]